jgi:hypothetical protein
MLSSTYRYIDVLPTTHLHYLRISYYTVSSVNLIGYKMLKCSRLLNTKFGLKSGKGTYHFSCTTPFINHQICFWIKPLFLPHYASYVTVTGNLQCFCKFHTVCILSYMNNDLRKKGPVNPLLYLRSPFNIHPLAVVHWTLSSSVNKHL